MVEFIQQADRIAAVRAALIEAMDSISTEDEDPRILVSALAEVLLEVGVRTLGPESVRQIAEQLILDADERLAGRS